MSRKVIIVLCLLSMIICHVLPNMAYLKADSEDVSYRISSNAIITYKKNENKVYYTREHFSSGSGIKYYTMYLVISMMEAKSTDDLSNLESNGDFSEIICVSVSGSSVTESSVIKSGDFYWYDSEKNDDGYIKTTYVIDGNVFLNLLDKAEVAGRSGAIYIHHVFAVAGGSENDDWHKKYGVKNNVPYYKYSDLMKVGWNDTTATHASQNACLNIPVPYSRPKTVDLGFVPYGSSGGSEISVTNTATPTPSLTSAPRVTPTPTPSPKVTPKPTVTPNPTVTAEPTGTPSPTVSPSPFVPGAIISLIPGIIGPIVNFPWPTPTPTPIPVYVEPIVPPAPTLTPTLIPTGSLVTSPSPEPVLYVTPEPTPTERPEISIQVVSGNIKYVQNLDADKDCAQVVLGNAVSQTLSLQIQNYDSDVRVSFPFDVYVENGTLLPSYTWNRMHSSYLVPEDTPEGRYTIRAAIETDSGNLSSYHEAELEVSGKLYGLGITNINTDAPDWKGVFGRDGVSSGNMVLYSGQNDEMGIGRGQGLNKTLPMVDGDSPNNNMCGMLKSGYTWTFRLNTCGDRMAKPNAHIVIVPTFYYICPEKGGGSYVEGYNAGGFSPRSQSSWTRERVRVYGTDLKEVGTRILASQTSSEMVGGEKTHREWTFEYSLPDVWYCASMEYDVEQYMEKKGGVTFKEEFWKKGGYLVVCFEIGAYDSSGKLVMTYSNKIENVMAGMCDMWRMENALKQKTDCLGTTFPLTEGDVVIVRLPGSTRDANGNPSPPTNASEDKTVSYK